MSNVHYYHCLSLIFHILANKWIENKSKVITNVYRILTAWTHWFIDNSRGQFIIHFQDRTKTNKSTKHSRADRVFILLQASSFFGQNTCNAMRALLGQLKTFSSIFKSSIKSPKSLFSFIKLNEIYILIEFIQNFRSNFFPHKHTAARFKIN